MTTLEPGRQSTPFLARIEACERLTPAERRIAGYFEDAYPRVALLNLSEVCAAVGVSSATVTRLARKLGYSDFRDLSQSLQAEVWQHLDSPRDRLAKARTRAPADDAARSEIDERFALASHDLRSTASGLDRTAFGQVADLICDPERPLILGAVASGQPLMRYFGLLLDYLRPGVTTLDGADRWAHDLAGLDASTVVLGAAFDRYPVPVQRLLRFARGKGATTVLLTNQRSSPIVPDADVSLFVVSHADSVFRSRVGLLFVIEALVDAVALASPGHGRRAEDVEQFFGLMGGYLTE